MLAEMTYYRPDRANSEIRYDAGWGPDGGWRKTIIIINSANSYIYM